MVVGWYDTGKAYCMWTLYGRKEEILHWPLNSRDPTPFHLSIFSFFPPYIQVYFCVFLCVRVQRPHNKRHHNKLWLRQQESQPPKTSLHHLHLVCGINDRAVCDNSLYWEVSEHRAWSATHSGVIESCELLELLLRRGNFIVYEVLLRRDYC